MGRFTFIWPHHVGVQWCCPECGQPCPLYDHQPERRWRHLDTCQYQTILHAEPPRSNCGEHGVRTVKLPWAEPSSRFTALFERLAIDWLQAASQKAVADQLNLSWDEVHAIQERAVQRGLTRRQAEPIERLGVDEKSFTKGHHYFTMVNDLDRSRVLFVAEHRTEESLDGFWQSVSEEQRAAVRGVAMDMWDPYINSTRKYLPDADRKIVFDKFHIAKHLGEAVDLVRRRENKQLKAAGDDRLTGTRYDWLRHPAKMEPDDRKQRPARKHYRWWHNWAIRCRLKPMIEKARMIQRRFDNIITYLRLRITNAASESINSKIQWVKYTARGFRSKKNFVTAIYFHCGGLDLMPSTH
jgi:transposase